MINQITITDPQDQIKSRLYDLKNQYDINIAHFCRGAVDEKISSFIEQLASTADLDG